MNERFYTVKELEEIFQVTRQAISAWIKSGKLKAHKLGLYWRVKESDLNKFLEENKSK